MYVLTALYIFYRLHKFGLQTCVSKYRLCFENERKVCSRMPCIKGYFISFNLIVWPTNHPLQKQERYKIEKQFYSYDITTQFRVSKRSKHEINKCFKNIQNNFELNILSYKNVY